MKGKTYIITGATRGIGLEAAARLGALGARLVLVGRNRDRGEAELARLRARVPGVAAEMHYADLSRCDEIVPLAGACSTPPRASTFCSTTRARSLRAERLCPTDSSAVSPSTTWAISGLRRCCVRG